jgi:hypothetical protein
MISLRRRRAAFPFGLLAYAGAGSFSYSEREPRRQVPIRISQLERRGIGRLRVLPGGKCRERGENGGGEKELGMGEALGTERREAEDGWIVHDR